MRFLITKFATSHILKCNLNHFPKSKSHLQFSASIPTNSLFAEWKADLMACWWWIVLTGWVEVSVIKGVWKLGLFLQRSIRYSFVYCLKIRECNLTRINKKYKPLF